MAEVATLASPSKLKANPENPRLIFHEEELRDLEDSIGKQGILVPLSVYAEGKHYVLLDGERRWRCATKLGLKTVPVLVQPKPGKLQNIMMMFAIHNAQKDWDPLPTAMKLEELEAILTKRHGRKPTERELAELASLAIGVLRRLKKLIKLPQSYRDELMKELKKPRSKQVVKVDHVLEITRGAAALRKRGVLHDEQEEETLKQALIAKVRSKVIANTVEPRRLPRMARAVERNEVTVEAVRRIIGRLMKEPRYSIEQAFKDSVEEADNQHVTLQAAQRLTERIEYHMKERYETTPELRATLRALRQILQQF